MKQCSRALCARDAEAGPCAAAWSSALLISPHRRLPDATIDSRNGDFSRTSPAQRLDRRRRGAAGPAPGARARAELASSSLTGGTPQPGPGPVRRTAADRHAPRLLTVANAFVAHKESLGISNLCDKASSVSPSGGPRRPRPSSDPQPGWRAFTTVASSNRSGCCCWATPEPDPPANPPRPAQHLQLSQERQRHLVMAVPCRAPPPPPCRPGIGCFRWDTFAQAAAMAQ